MDIHRCSKLLAPEAPRSQEAEGGQWDAVANWCKGAEGPRGSQTVSCESSLAEVPAFRALMALFMLGVVQIARFHSRCTYVDL